MASTRFDLEHATLDAAGGLLSLRWGDGHLSNYPWAYLRAACPCASCGTAAPPLPLAAAAATLSDLAEVGHYALNLIWADGHRTGIYTFEGLRRLCPCCGGDSASLGSASAAHAQTLAQGLT